MTAERRWCGWWLCAVALCGVGALAPRAEAAQPSPQDKAAAEALFLQAKGLMAENKLEVACSKWAASEQLDPAVGTLLFLGDCYEKLGRTASAWATFAEAASLAEREGQAGRRQIADVRAAALKPQLSTITVTVLDAGTLPGLHVLRDGVELPRDSWGAPVPLDPGPHQLEANAAGYRSWSHPVELAPNGAALPVTIPRLERLPDQAPGPAPAPSMAAPATAGPAGPEPAAATAEGGAGPLLTAGLVTGGVGLGGMVLGTVFGLLAKSANDDSMADCRTDTLCSQDGLDLRQTAKGRAAVSTTGFIAGGTLTAAGIVMVAVALTGQGSDSAPPPGPSAAFAPMLGPGELGLTWRGRW
jgi:hypothetical protein